MTRLKLPLILAFLFVTKIGMAQSPAAIKDYIQAYKDAAIEDMKSSGVPAAITLAQGIHETEAGRSDLVLQSNNHFGIKCKSGWAGETVSHDDDAKGECFRKYPSALDSYKDHSLFLHSSRYAFLFQLDPTDYKAWAYGLKKAGYATNPKYPQILIKLIEDYGLQDYTLVAMGRKSPQPQDSYIVEAGHRSGDGTVSEMAAATSGKEISYPQGVFKINETAVVFVPKGVAYLAVAEEHTISLRRLFEFNDMRPQEVTTTDQLIFLQRKRKTGANEFHKVAPNETIYAIAQTEAIRMESLLWYNFLDEGMQPQVGEVLYLRKSAPAMPKLVTASAAIINTADNGVAQAIPTKNNIWKDVTKTAPAPAESEAQNKYTVHVVQPKETVYSISKQYAVSMEDVLKWNELPTPDLKIGQELHINKSSNATN